MAQDRKIFVEIGAGAFDNSLKLLQTGWLGYFVEANPDIAHVLQRQLRKRLPNDYRYKVDGGAISTFNGETKLLSVDFSKIDMLDPENEWISGISVVNGDQNTGGRLPNQPAFSDKLTEYTVQCWTLDTWIHERIGSEWVIDYMKIDVEGHEYDILRSYSWFKKPKFMKVEHKHTNADGVQAILEQQGYMVYKERDDFYAILP